MRVFAVALALSTVLTVAPMYAQEPAPAEAPAAPTPQLAPPAAPEAAFQAGLKYAFINIQRIANESADGRAANEKIKALQDQRIREVQDKTKAIQGNQEKLERDGSVMNDQARQQLQREIERQQLDLQRFTEDAQEDVAALTQQLQMDFERKLMPIIDTLAREKDVHMVFNDIESGLVWAIPGMDLTADIIRALNAAEAPAAGGAR